MTDLVPLATVPTAAVEALLDAAFGTDRLNRTAYRLREGLEVIAELSFAAMERGSLVGSIQCWPMKLGHDVALTLVGPVAVRPELQRGGIGRMLMTRCLQAAETPGHDALVMIGDPEYYGRFFGFSADATAGWQMPGPVERHRLLARITRPGGVPSVGVLAPDTDYARRAATA